MGRIYRQCIVGLLLATGQPLALLAQDSTSNSNPMMDTLQQVTITATRRKVDLLSLPYSVDHISRSQLDVYQYRTTPEALTATTGVFIQKTNHGGGSAFIRGLTGNQTLLLVDGIRLNNATFRYGPNQYLNTVDAYSVSRIEVARGTGSVQYGSDALGGVIQVFTKDPSFAEKTSLHSSFSGKAATQGMEYTGRAELMYASGKLALMAGYTNRHFGDVTGGDTTGKQSPSGYNEQGLDVKLKWKPFSNSVLTISHQLLQQKNVPLYHRVKLENYAYYLFAPQQRQMSYAKWESKTRHRLIEKIVVTGSFQNNLEKRNYHRNNNTYKYVETDRVKTFGLTADVASLINTFWSANSGIEYYYDKVNSHKIRTPIGSDTSVLQRGLYPDNASSANFSMYTLHHFSIKKFKMETGLRYNKMAIHIPGTVQPVTPLENIKVTPASLVSNIAILYRLAAMHSVYTAFSTGYRAPNIDDLGTLGLVDFRYEIPAYDLQPEKTYNTEIGYRYSNKKLEVAAAFYYMHVTNIITRIQVAGQQVGGYNVYTKQNSQQSYIKGAEASLDLPIKKSWHLHAASSYTYGQNTSANEPMRRIPPLNGNLQLSWQKKAWRASVEQLFATKQYRLAKGDKEDNRIPAGGTPGWNVVNFFAGYEAKYYAIRMGAINLFNKDYRTHGSGINGTGRSAWISLQLRR